ncbi:MAG: hypothetical protein RL375_2601 [Pseudomonadota bacterium]|jgi:cyclopropane-fatty-acyl-phospholipid synthase
MGLLSLEQDETLVWADFAVYALLVLLCGATVLLTMPEAPGWPAAAEVGADGPIGTWRVLADQTRVWLPLAWVLAGWWGWSLAEYLLHRFVLHGVPPFRRMHALHHARPLAHVATPTVVTVALFGLLVALPAAWWLAPWQASALMLGVLGAYLVYIATHHAVHHAHGTSSWLRRHKRWHAMHHLAGARACYGVSLPLWDHVFRTARARVRQRTDMPAPRA